MVADVLLFDVNETLLDMSATDGIFEELFGDAGARELWFEKLLSLVLTGAVTGDYRDFSSLTHAALRMTAARRGVAVDDADCRSLAEALSTLPPYPDVRPALELLRGRGYRLAALTNGTRRAVESQLRHAGLRDIFEQAFSADDVARYKPAPEPYRMAVTESHADAGECRMVAAHAWDIAGARAAGLKTAFVRRPGQVPDPAAAPPDMLVDDLAGLAAALPPLRELS